MHLPALAPAGLSLPARDNLLSDRKAMAEVARPRRRRRAQALPRRKTVRWSAGEVDGLLSGVREHGVGKWAAILRSSPAFNPVRTSVDLKDKWRNLASNVRALALRQDIAAAERAPRPQRARSLPTPPRPNQDPLRPAPPVLAPAPPPPRFTRPFEPGMLAYGPAHPPPPSHPPQHAPHAPHHVQPSHVPHPAHSAPMHPALLPTDSEYYFGAAPGGPLRPASAPAPEPAPVDGHVTGIRVEHDVDAPPHGAHLAFHDDAALGAHLAAVHEPFPVAELE